MSLSGELDITVVDELRDRFTGAIAENPLVEVDLNGLTFIDSAAISVLVSAYHAAALAGGALTVANARGRARRVLVVTGILPLLTDDAAGSAPSS